MVRLAKKKKVENKWIFVFVHPAPPTHTQHRYWIFIKISRQHWVTSFSFLFLFLGTMMETSTCRFNFLRKPGKWGRERFPSFLLIFFIPRHYCWETHQRIEPDMLQTRLKIEGFLPESSQRLWNSCVGSILCPSQYSQAPSDSYFCLWQLTSEVFSAFS